MELTAIYHQHDNSSVLCLTDRSTRLLLIQTRTSHQIFSVDDERRMEFHRVAQVGSIGKCANLQMILFVKADDLPCISHSILQLLSLGFSGSHMANHRFHCPHNLQNQKH